MLGYFKEYDPGIDGLSDSTPLSGAVTTRRRGLAVGPAFWGLCAGLSLVLALRADDPRPKENPKYTISPKTVVRGKDYNVVIRPRGDCQAPGPLHGVQVDLDKVSGFKAENAEGGDGCFLRFKLSVLDDAPLGDLNVPLVTVTADGKKSSFEALTLYVSSVDRGPIPPGLEEQADIFWKVLPRRATSDSFGRAFTKRYFAVEAVIGNNTGYDLQIASIGFEPPVEHKLDAPVPTDSYNVGRSTLEREQQVGARALVVNTITGLGPILTGAGVFFKAAGASSTWKGAVGLFSNPFEKGFELVYPDKTVRQLIGLDTRTLRDSVIIPNNISQRVLVFISRELAECRKRKKARSCDWKPETPKKDARLPYANDFDPEMVMRRLGTLVVVGRKIEYLNRVRVVSTPQPIVSPPPVVQPSSELKIAQGTTNKDFTLTGNALRGAGVSVEAGAGPKLTISGVAPNADGTQIQFKASAAYDCEAKKYKLYVSNPSGTQTLEIEVTAEAPSSEKGPDPPSLTQGETGW
ncbi:MAG: hypothetical protein HY238_17775 [Acidobacteria bacterium]|nr:hypothetical protein [Acidobacteriota bacterium]